MSEQNSNTNQDNTSFQLQQVKIIGSDIFTDNQQSIKNSIRKTQGSILQNTILQKTQFQQSQTQNRQQSMRDFSILPQKYNNLIHRTTQIPRTSIKKLIQVMDSNKDGYITVEDIIQFSQKYFLFFERELAESMFYEASIRRIITNNQQLNAPLNEDEILAAVQVHYKLDSDHQWEKNPRQFRDKWISLLEAIGEQTPTKHDLSLIKIQKIYDLHEKNDNTFKPKLNQSKSQVSVRPLPPKVYVRPFRAEAGIVINNTEHVQEIVMDEHYDSTKFDPFEKVVNGKMQTKKYSEFEQDYPLIKFETRQYYQQAETLSKHPEQLKGRNPIYSYVPENLNFHVKPKQQEQEQQKKQIRFSKGFSNLQSPEFHESAFYKEIDEMQENEEMNSITMLQEQQMLATENKKPQSQTNVRKMSSIPHIPSINNKHSFGKLQSDHNHNAMNQDYSGQNQQLQTLDCRTIKQKLASQEPVNDAYVPPSSHEFRPEYVHPQNKPHFNVKAFKYIKLNKTRSKVDPLPNPQAMSEHDQRPQFAIEKELRARFRKEMEDKKIRDQYMGNFIQEKDWLKYFRQADRQHNFVDNGRPDFIDKGGYVEQADILNSLLRGGDTDLKIPFKLFHRQLRKYDKNAQLGQNEVLKC